MNLMRLTSETPLGGFDCGDTDNFLIGNVKKFPRQANRHIICPC